MKLQLTSKCDEAFLCCPDLESAIARLAHLNSGALSAQHSDIRETAPLSENKLFFVFQLRVADTGLVACANEKLVIQKDNYTVLSLAFAIQLPHAVKADDTPTRCHQIRLVSQRRSKCAL